MEGRVISPDSVFGEDSDAVVVASVEHETGNENIPVSEGPGRAWLETLATSPERHFWALMIWWMCRMGGVPCD